MKANYFSYVILIVCLTVVSSEFFSSVHEVTKLMEYERFLLGKMEKFVSLNENKLNYLKEKLSELEREREEALDAGDEYFENPINKYLLTKRLSLDWERMENLLDHEAGTNVMKSIERFRANWTFPGEEDYNGAMEGLLRLQRIYRLDTKDIANGILGGVKYEYTTELSAKDCFYFGSFAFKQGYLLAAHAWFSEALERFGSYTPSVFDELFEKPNILEPLAKVKFKLGDYKGAAELSYSLHLWRPYDRRVRQLLDYYIKQAQVRNSIVITSEHEPIPDDLDDIDQYASYRFTCSGHIHQLPSHERDLRCMYLSHTHPFLLLAPIKVEELNLDPLLLLYHDVIYDSEIEKILELANNKMQRATVASSNGSMVSTVRTSQFSFHQKADHKVFQTIDERVADMTGMNMNAAENPQVANYGIGGHYSIHNDFFDKETLPLSSEVQGNRISTVLFYLTDVEQGGGTALPYMKRLVKPKKGAAAYWYNLHASGDGDMWTRHGACPVLVGSKWVLTRWIRERGQEFIRPCKLYSDALDTSEMF